MKNAIIIGASSGIGRELALQLSAEGYRLCVTARRRDLLEELLLTLGDDSFMQEMDVADTDSAIELFTASVEKMGSVDLVILCAGTGFIDSEMPWENDSKTIGVNVCGFTALANTAYKLFSQQGYGHLVGISSIAALRGGEAAAYNASKAYVSSYLEGLRVKAMKSKFALTVTDIRPGLVDTRMAQGEGLFWVASPEQAVKQMVSAIMAKKKQAYVTRRWGLIALLLKVLPDALYARI